MKVGRPQRCSLLVAQCGRADAIYAVGELPEARRKRRDPRRRRECQAGRVQDIRAPRLRWTLRRRENDGRATRGRGSCDVHSWMKGDNGRAASPRRPFCPAFAARKRLASRKRRSEHDLKDVPTSR
jgi:hypothetical protein